MLVMRKLGIDFGSKKVGIALTDESGTMAFPHGVWPNDSELLAKVEQLIEAEGVMEIVIGHSKNKDGSDNVVQAKIEEFIGDLTLRLPVPIHLQPEQYSTQEALRIQGRNDQTDAAAAAIILDSYLTKKK